MAIRVSPLPHIRRLAARPLTAPLWRAWIEAVGLGVALLVVIWLMQSNLTPGERQNGLFIALLSTMSWYGIRLRRGSGRWWWRIGFELVAGLPPALGAGCLVLGIGLRIMPECQQVIDESGLLSITILTLIILDMVVIKGESLPELTIDLSRQTLPVISSVLISGVIAFVTSRGLMRLWQYWARLRRRHLIWALTHSHMMLIVLGIFLLATVITVNSVVFFTNKDTYTLVSVLIGIIPVLIIIGFMTMMLVIITLPPALALSYFAARRTTRRLQALTDATARLSRGDYSVRVPVQGEDEVAALQTDFNVMALDLERAIHDVQTQRDHVAALLHDRRELVASVSHELRTPVAVLSSHLESMLGHWDDRLPDELKHDLTVMDNETTRLQRLLEDLFTLSRAEVGGLAITCVSTDLQDVIRRAAAAAAPTLWQTAKVELVIDLPDDLPPALVDALRLEQILHNLLRNSVRHTPPGGIIAITAAVNGNRVQICVQDTGEGIAPEHLPHIWERFYRADSARSRDHSGAGLGLALVKELTEAMGGTVDVASTPGMGSTFSVFLPCACDTSATISR